MTNANRRIVLYVLPIGAPDVVPGTVIATYAGWARVVQRINASVWAELLPWWSPARVWRTVAQRVGLGGWV